MDASKKTPPFSLNLYLEGRNHLIELLETGRLEGYGLREVSETGEPAEFAGEFPAQEAAMAVTYASSGDIPSFQRQNYQHVAAVIDMTANNSKGKGKGKGKASGKKVSAGAAQGTSASGSGSGSASPAGGTASGSSAASSTLAATDKRTPGVGAGGGGKPPRKPTGKKNVPADHIAVDMEREMEERRARAETQAGSKKSVITLPLLSRAARSLRRNGSLSPGEHESETPPTRTSSTPSTSAERGAVKNTF